MIMILFTATAFVIISLLIPTNALAWGMGVHLQIGSHILENLQLLAPAMQELLQRYPHDYLYGCISADITLGKKYTHYLNHCHSWRMGEKILASARTDPQRACALGYLGHLAADTVAHSYYVPFQLVRTFNTLMLKHTYWEVRFESLVQRDIWTLARVIARKDFSENDAMMRSVLSDTLFSFGTNKRLFNSLMLLSRLQQWQKMLRSMAESSKWTLEVEERREYLELAIEATLSIFNEREESPFHAPPRSSARTSICCGWMENCRSVNRSSFSPSLSRAFGRGLRNRTGCWNCYPSTRKLIQNSQAEQKCLDARHRQSRGIRRMFLIRC